MIHRLNRIEGQVRGIARMINEDVYTQLKSKFVDQFGGEPDVSAYAPGRVEVIGNHTDYNEGFVLSAAINYGTFFVASLSDD